MGFKATYQNLNTNWGNDSANTWAAQGQSLRLEYTNGPLNVQYAQSSRQDAE